MSADVAITEAPPPPPRKWTSARVAGYVFSIFWIACAVSCVAYFAAGYDAEFVSRYLPRMIGGLWTTVWIVGLSIVLGAALSVPVAFARNSENLILAGLGYGYVNFLRGTPLLAQIFLIYYGAGQFREALEAVGLWWFFREAVNCAIFAFTLNTSAYQAEIYLGAVRNIPKGQWEGARALGISDRVTFFKIIVPQAAMIALRPLGNEIILMIKGSAIASIITVFDLMGETRLAFSRSFDFQVYLWAALMYLAIVETLRRIWDRLEQRLTRHLVR